MTEDGFSTRDKCDELARFVGYGVLRIIHEGRTIYYNKPETEEQEKRFMGEIFLYANNHTCGDWNPFENAEDANKCEEKLREVGGYNYVGFDYKYMNVVRATFTDSGPEWGIRGEGKDKLEAICNVCLNFMKKNNSKVQ